MAATPKKRKSPQVGNLFQEQLKLALEHFQDVKWLGEQSPLSAPYFLGDHLLGQSNTQAALGRGQVLQKVLHEAMEIMSKRDREGTYGHQLLDMRFIHPKALDYIMDSLYVGRTTYYRHETKALEMLEEVLIGYCYAPMRIDLPVPPKVLVGRDYVISQCLESLNAKQTILLSGSSGIGKTATAATIAATWIETHTPQSVFWYALRRGLNDQIYSLIFMLAHFFHKLGASSLWLQLLAEKKSVSVTVALSLISHDLNRHNIPAPLLCIDDIDLLHPNEIEEHAQIAFFLALLHNNLPVLLAGQINPQQRLIETDADYVLDRLTEEDIRTWVTGVAAPIALQDVGLLSSYTNGNPHLVALFVTLQQSGESLKEAMAHIPSSPTVLTLLNRIRRRLEADDLNLLEALSIFRQACPRDAWAPAPLAKLERLNLIRSTQYGSIELLPAIKTAIQSRLTLNRKESLHLLAAQVRSTRGEYTAAVSHYVAANQIEMAVWVWYAYRRTEIDFGKAREALVILEQIPYNLLSHKASETLTLLKGELQTVLGNLNEAHAELSAIPEKPDSILHIIARKMQSGISIRKGDFARAIEEIKAGLDATTSMLEIRQADLHVNLSAAIHETGDWQSAWYEAQIAECELHNVKGYIKLQINEYDEAQRYFLSALAIAQQSDLKLNHAKISYNLSALHMVQGNFSLASQHLKSAEQYFEKTGDLARLARVKTSMAGIHVEAEEPLLAVLEATQAINIYRNLDLPNNSAYASHCLAEAYLQLKAFDKAESHIMYVLKHPVPALHPYSNLTLSELRLRQGNLVESELLCHQVVQSALLTQNQRLVAITHRVMAEIYYTKNNLEEAQASLHKAIAIFNDLSLAHERQKAEILLNKIAK